MDEPSLNPYESPQEVDTRSTRRPKPEQRPRLLSGIGRVGLIFLGLIAFLMLHSFLNHLCMQYGSSNPPPAPQPLTAPPNP